MPGAVTQEETAVKLAEACRCYRNVEGEVWCPPGWANVVEALGVALGDKAWGAFEVLQVKEKMGHLRVYIKAYADTDRARVAALVGMAEHLCENICQECGSSPAALFEHGGRWRTVCDDCVST